MLERYSQNNLKGTSRRKIDDGAIERMDCSNSKVKSKPRRQGEATAGPNTLSA